MMPTYSDSPRIISMDFLLSKKNNFSLKHKTKKQIFLMNSNTTVLLWESALLSDRNELFLERIFRIYQPIGQYVLLRMELLIILVLISEQPFLMENSYHELVLIVNQSA